MRFDLSSLGVLALAVASSLTVLWWMEQAGLRGQAHAAEIPAVHAPATGDPAQVLKAADGHYWAEAQIDGRAVHVMVDTGASLVVLTPADAARLGLRLKTDDFSATVATASGPVRAAPVQLQRRTGRGPGGRAGVAPLPAGHELPRPPVRLHRDPGGADAEAVGPQTAFTTTDSAVSTM
jgi:aspartyl protease family protein